MTQDASESQTAVDARNAAFWDELCGSAFARELGIQDVSEESLRRFDAAYMSFYPYLEGYVPDRLTGEEVLEIGLGYGTLSEALFARGANLHGVDIAEGPVEMVRHRMRLSGHPEMEGQVVQASALDLPHAANRFDRVFAIGCLHHTGDTARAVTEVHRVLRPGGTAVVMLYNRNSFRQLTKVTLPALFRRRQSAEQVAALYDTNAAGEAAPHVDYIARREVRRIFSPYSKVAIDVRNFDSTRFIRREWTLGTVDRVLGLDLYITARK